MLGVVQLLDEGRVDLLLLEVAHVLAADGDPEVSQGRRFGVLGGTCPSLLLANPAARRLLGHNSSDIVRKLGNCRGDQDQSGDHRFKDF